MAYDEDLANRIREQLGGVEGVTETKMFGGLAFLLNGNMAIAASGRGGLLVRVDPDWGERALGRPHVAPMEMRGRSMTGWIRVAPEGIATTRQLAGWVKRGATFAGSLPRKG